jgi:hypothetical protein
MVQEAFFDVLFRPHVTKRAADLVAPMEEVRLATALGLATCTSTLGNSVRDRRPAVSKDRAAFLLYI